MTFWLILTALCLFLGLMLMGCYIIGLVSVESHDDDATDRAIAECEARIKARLNQDKLTGK